MASIRQRSGTWQARVRRKGYPDEVASFKTKTEAQAWARSVESTMDQGSYQSAQSATYFRLEMPNFRSTFIRVVFCSGGNGSASLGNSCATMPVSYLSGQSCPSDVDAKGTAC